MNSKTTIFLLTGFLILIICFIILNYTTNSIIEDGDYNFKRKNFIAAEQQYLSAEEKLNWLPFSSKGRSLLKLKIGILKYAQNASTIDISKCFENAILTSEEILYNDLKNIAEKFDISIADSIILTFRKLEFQIILPKFLRRDSPLHKSEIVVEQSNRKEFVDIIISYNQKDMTPADSTSSTRHIDIYSLKNDVQFQMVNIIQQIINFAKFRKMQNGIEYISLACHHGVRQSFFGIPSFPGANQKPKIIYLTKTNVLKLMDYQKLNLSIIIDTWEVVVDEFPNLNISKY
jgi:hypothetical protein